MVGGTIEGVGMLSSGEAVDYEDLTSMGLDEVDLDRKFQAFTAKAMAAGHGTA